MTKERVVISGVNGFVGHHLSEELSSAGISVVGIGREDTPTHEVEPLLDEYHKIDLINSWPNIKNIKAIIHLAGLAAVGASYDNPQAYINANSAMVTNLCEYYAQQESKARIIIVSSGAIYDSQQPMPITEDGEMGFASPYAVSKVLNENQAAYYRKRGLDCVVVRPFNHIGPGQGPGFILPDLHERLSASTKDQRTISVGNLNTRRDYTDVRDIVRAYSKVALTPVLQHNVYNICSGVSLSGVEIFSELTKAMNLPDVSYEVDKSLLRPSDIQEITGNSNRLQDELGWQPQYPIEQTIADFVRHEEV